MQGNRDNQQISDGNSILELTIFTSIGDREEQQDSFGYMIKHNEAIIVICDGMGGHQGGKIASSLAVNEILTEYETNYPCRNIVGFLEDTAQNASNKIYACEGRTGNRLNAGSTSVVVVIRDKYLYWNSVGDSRAYLYRNGEFAQLTLDHNYKTVLTERLNAGIIDRNEFSNESERGEALISYLGMNELKLIDYNNEELLLNEGDKIVVMTDGLYKAVSEEDIFKIIGNFSNISEATQALEKKAQRNTKNYNNRDNMTVAIIAIR